MRSDSEIGRLGHCWTNVFPGNATITNNNSEQALCAMYAIQDSVADNEVLREHPAIEEWGGTVLIIILYACLRRANQDSDPFFDLRSRYHFFLHC